MSIRGDDSKEIELYIKHKKDVLERLSGDLVEKIGVDNMLYGLVWKMYCNCIDEQIPRESRKETILKIVSKEIDKWA